MSPQKSKWIIFTAVLACIGCCAIPLYAVIASATSIGLLAALISKKNIEVLVCLAPLLLIAIGYYFYRHKNREKCCNSNTRECSSTHCNITKGEHQ